MITNLRTIAGEMVTLILEVLVEAEDGVAAVVQVALDMVAVDVLNLTNVAPMVAIVVEEAIKEATTTEGIMVQVIGRTVLISLDLVTITLRRSFLVHQRTKKRHILVSILTSMIIFLLRRPAEMSLLPLKR